MQKLYRHGEIGFLEIAELPTNLQRSQTNTIMKGSHGNDHTFSSGALYLSKDINNEFVNGFVFGYFVAKNTKLIHTEHSPKGEATLPDGVYELLKQQEFTPQGLVPVID